MVSLIKHVDIFRLSITQLLESSIFTLKKMMIMSVNNFLKLCHIIARINQNKFKRPYKKVKNVTVHITAAFQY